MTWVQFFDHHFAQLWWLIGLSVFWVSLMWAIK